ncbi:MAG TPA: DM13 domain-containing protein [Burkholderiales bacterium]|nr:DM13 domain-containing protein [Burkholderiales bacterium]
MRTYVVIFFAALVLGAFAGFALGIFVYPYLFLADIVATEKVPEKQAGEARKVLASGKFIHANPSDPIHYGKGGVTVYENLLHLEADFEVGPGPKFHVYLVPEKDVLPSTNVERTMFVDLGRLKAFKGSQNFDIPAGVEIANYGSVVIWCEQFGVLISPARLEPGVAASTKK